MSDLRAYLGLYLRGDAAAKARDVEQAFEQLGRRGAASVGALSRSMSTAGKALDGLANRYTALASGAMGAGTARMIANFDTELTKLQIASGATAEKMDAFKKRMFEVARLPHIRLDPGQLLSAVAEIVERTGDLDYAIANLEDMGVAMRATFSEGIDIGGLASELKKLNIATDGVGTSLAVLKAQGDMGAFTLQKLSTKGAEMISAYATMGRTGIDAVREVGGIAQVAMQATAQADTAKTAVVSLINELQNAEKQKKLKALGIQLFDPEQLKQGKRVYRSIPEIMKEVITKTKGNGTKIGAIFGDEAMKAYNTAIVDYQKTGGFENTLDKFVNAKADTAKVIEDAKTATQAAGVALMTFTSAWEVYANKRFAEPIKDLARWVNSIDEGKLETAMDVATLTAGGLGAAIVGRKLYQGGKAVAGAFGKRGVAEAVAGAAGAVGAKGAMPVIVTNWPGQFGGGGMGLDMSGSRSAKGRVPSARGGLAGLAGRGGRLLGMVGRGNVALALTTGAVDMGSSLLSGDTRGAVTAGGRTAGALGGAAAGAAIGSVVPVVGTVAGGLVGGIIGAMGGEALFQKLYDLMASDKEEKQKPAEVEGSIHVRLDVGQGVNARVQSIQSSGGVGLDVGKTIGTGN
ncbi:MAG: hypothetical protein AB1918_07825 [Pseudomonadota bacterium]